MKKKILIDASTVTSQLDGLSHYILNLIKYLPEESFNQFDYSVLINKGLQRKAIEEVLKDPRIEVIEAKIAPIGPLRDWDMFWFLRKHGKRFDLVHITSNNYPFALRNGICTIHDITFKKYFDNPRFTFKLAPFYMDKVIRNALKRARAIITVSAFTRNDLIETYHLKATTSNKIQVIHQGWEHLVHEIDADEADCESEMMVKSDYLLYVGTFRVHKNISNLLLSFRKAMEGLPANKKLVVIGSDKHLQPKDQAVIDDINKNGQRVVFTGYLSQACVEKYFQQADAYIFPSLSEGFGLGVLESFYYNIPLLCSNTTSLPEIAGDAALYFDPYKTDEIAYAILRFYGNGQLRDELVERGKKRLQQFSWKKNAAEAVKLYGKVLQDKS